MTAATTTLTVKSELENLSEIRRFIETSAQGAGLSEEAVSALRLAVDEACANIILHGYKEHDGEISVLADIDGLGIRITLSDTAPAFNPLVGSAAPALDLPLEDRPVGGMGVMLIKQNVDDLTYQQGANGENILVLTKYK